jgi:hypothetical protein
MNRGSVIQAEQLLSLTLREEFDWIEQLFIKRQEGLQKKQLVDIYSITPPSLSENTSSYAMIIRKYHLQDFGKRLFFAVATAAAISPQIFSAFNREPAYTDQFVFRQNQNSPFVLPTIETVIFILSGSDLEQRLKSLTLFNEQACFSSLAVLQHHEPLQGEPVTSIMLCLTSEMADLIIMGKKRAPKFSRNFPARLLHTKAEWENLILRPQTFEQLEHVKIWLMQRLAFMEDPGLKKRFNPGFKVLFYGPPGTGKTMAAGLLGKQSKMDVYRIDLSMVVSKYIGETEKNLSVVFDKLESSETILFFDEADSLFGKRTQTKDSHDRYANQEISYLLQRIEDYDGLVILATNLKDNLDNAFLRRFNSIIYFPIPTAEECFLLWKQGFSEKIFPNKDVNMKELATKYQLTGAQIMNVVYYSTLVALNKNQDH